MIKRLWIPVIGVLMLALAACAGSTTEKPDESALRVTFTTSPATIDPAMACALDDFELITSTYVQLVQYKHQPASEDTTMTNPSEVDPYLAKSWSTNDAGTEYIFHLNENWTFPDGTPMDAEAVKFSFDRVIAMGGCGATNMNDLYTDPYLIQTVTAIDPVTLKITLTRPDGMFLEAMATPSASIVNPTLVNAHGGVEDGKVNEWMTSNYAGGGAFLLDSYAPGTSAVLKRNPNFKGEPAAAPQIDVRFVSSGTTATLNAQDESSDVTLGLPNSSVTSIEKSQSGPRVVRYDSTETMQMLLPNDKAPWTDKRVRQAVVLAIPYDDILKSLLNGNGKLYYGPIAPSMPGYDAEASKPIINDVAQAKALIKSSGIQTPIPITLDILSGDPTQKELATVIQSSLKEIGFAVKVQSLDSSAWGDAVYGGKTQSALRLDGPAIINAGYYLQYDELCDAQYNTGHICIPANTDLLAEARGSNDPRVQNAAYSEITKNWVAEYPRVNLYQQVVSVVLSSSMTSFHYANMVDMRTWSK